MSFFHDTWEKVKEHPAIFAGVAGIVLLFIFWPKASTTASSGTADQASIANSIATSAAANADVQSATLGANTQVAGIDASRDVALDQDATALALANVSAGVNNSNNSALLAANTNNNATELSLAALVNSSQDSAQKFITGLETAHLSSPTVSTTGGNFGATTAPAVVQAAPPPVAVAPAAAPVAAAPASSGPTNFAVINGITTVLLSLIPPQVTAYFAGGGTGQFHIRKGSQYDTYVQEANGSITDYSDPAMGAAIVAIKNPTNFGQGRGTTG